jgi:predicted dehydrogenase
MTGSPAVRWGFLGAGFVASRGMAPAVHAARGATLQVVGARDPMRAATLEPVRAVGSYEEVLAADDVDAVYISLPNDAHLGWVRAALAAGKHVLCEKPLGRTADEVVQMQALAEAAGLLLVEAAWNRWHPRFRQVSELLSAAPGPRTVRAWFTFPGVPADNYRLRPERGGGALLDVGCYAVGAALVSLGAGEVGASSMGAGLLAAGEPGGGESVEVTEVSRSIGPTGVDLTTEARLAHPNGSAQVLASFERPESQGWVVTAPGLEVELMGQAFTTWRSECSLRVVEDGRERVEHFPARDPYQLMVEAVSDRVRGQEAWILPLETSREVAGVLDRIAATRG